MSAAALPPDPPIAAIVITGRALEQPASERAFAVERFDRKRIDRSPSHELDQLLKEVPGLTLFRRSDSRSSHPTSQGVTLRSLGGNASSRALLLLDGVPQSDPFGGWVNWPAYDPGSLAEIRVIRGGGSVASGPGALAGTIELTSRSESGIGGDISMGSRESVEARGRIGFEAGAGRVSLSGSASRSDGFIPVSEDSRGPVDRRAPSREWNGRGRWLAPLAPGVELQANLSGFHDRRERGTDFTANRTNGADASLRLVGRGAWQWSALGYWQWRSLRSSFASVGAGRSTVSRASLQDKVPSHGLGASFELRPPMPGAGELRLGADVRRNDGKTHELYSYVAGSPTRRRVAGGEGWTAGAFAEASAQLGSLTLTGGARLDRWRVSDGRLFEQLIAGGAVLRDEAYPARGGWRPTGRIGLAAPFPGPLMVRAAAYQGWRLPTLNELFRPFRAGLDATAANPLLDPERLRGAEAGLDWNRGPVRLGLTAFTNRLSDPIANVTLAQGPGNFPSVGFIVAGGQYRQRQNLNAIRVRGVEANGEWARGPWALRGGISWTRARVQAVGAAAPLDGLRPAQTPRFAATLSGGWEQDGKAAQLLVRHVGPQYEDDLNQRLLPSATTLDAFSTWPLGRKLQLIARAENLTDEHVVAGIGGDGAVERATPRTIWLGISLRP